MAEPTTFSPSPMTDQPVRTASRWSDALIVLELPWESQSLDYRPYAESVGEESLLRWVVSRLRNMTDAAAPVIVLAGPGDAERAGGLLCGVSDASVRSVSSLGDLQGLSAFVGGEIRPNRILLVELSVGLLPLELADALLDHHRSHRCDATALENVPCASPPLIIETSLIKELLSGAIPGLPSNTRVALAALERALKTVDAPHPIRLQGVSLVSDAEQARRGWPYSVALENHEDVAILRQVLRSKDEAGGQDDLLTVWTAVRVQRERNRANFIRQRLKKHTMHASAVANRVLFVTAPSALSGAEQVLALLNQRLGLQANSPISRMALVAQPGVLTQRLVSGGADVLVANKNFAVNSVENLLYCRSVLEDVQPSLVHANGLIGVPFTWALLERGVPLVQHVHVANRGLIELEEQLRCAAAVIAVSAYVRQRLLRCGVDPALVHVVHNGIEVDHSGEPADLARQRMRREHAIDPRAAVLLMVARFDRNKRHDLAIHAFAKLLARPRPVVLLLVGEVFQEGEVFQTVRQRISGAGLGNHVRFLGFQRDMRTLYMGSDALVLPAENDAFPQAILEAMSAKLPVVAARSGGAPEMITDRESGLLVEPGDSDALASALDEVLSDEQLRARLAENALYRCLNEFSDSRHVSGILNVYARVLQSYQ